MLVLLVRSLSQFNSIILYPGRQLYGEYHSYSTVPSVEWGGGGESTQERDILWRAAPSSVCSWGLRREAAILSRWTSWRCAGLLRSWLVHTSRGWKSSSELTLRIGSNCIHSLEAGRVHMPNITYEGDTRTPQNDVGFLKISANVKGSPRKCVCEDRQRPL